MAGGANPLGLAGNTGTVAMFDPSGNVRQVSPGDVQAALNSGGEQAIGMLDPQGNHRWVRNRDVNEALQNQGRFSDPSQEQNMRLARLGVAPTGDVYNPEDDAMADLARGGASSLAEMPATVGRWANRILHTQPGPVTQAFQSVAANKPDSIAGTIGAGLENIAEWMVGEGELKAVAKSEQFRKLADATKILERYPRLAEVLRAHPDVVKLLPSAGQQAVLGTAQTALHGGNLQQSLESGLTAGSIGLAVPMTVGGIMGRAAQTAEAVQPTVRDLEGARFTQTAAEFRSPTGESLGTRAAQEAVQGGLPERLIAERQGAFAQMQQNLAKRGIGNYLTDLNEQIRGSSVSPDVQATTAPGGPASTTPVEWRYIPPGGRTSLSPDEAQSALNELKQRWLDTDLGDRRTAEMRAAYDDMREQVNRHQDYIVQNQPWQPHDVKSAVNGVEDYGDAASRVELAARQMTSLASEDGRAAYNDLLSRREAAQQAFDEARYDIKARDAASQRIRDINQQLEQIYDVPELTGNLSPEMAAAARKATRVSNGFQELQNTMNDLFGLRRSTAGRISRPYLASDLGKRLSDSIESIRSRYGDVLNPLIGDQGLDHIIELGDIIDSQPRGAERAGTLLDNVGAVLRRRYQGVRGMVAGGAAGGAILAHYALHSALGTAGALGVLATEAVHRRVLQELATNPRFAEKFLYAMRSNIPARVAAPLLASATTLINRGIQSQQQQEQQPETQAQPPPEPAQPTRSPYMAVENPRGLVEQGNLPIWNRPLIHNADGSVSSDYSISREENGREVLVPTIVNGRFLTPDGKKPPEGSKAEQAMFNEAWKHYKETGENFGKFGGATEKERGDNADAYANQLHNRSLSR